MPFPNQLSVLFSNLDIFLEPYNNLQHSHPWKKNIFIFFGRCNSYPGCNLIHQTNLRYSMKDKCIDWIHWMTNHGQIINIFGQNSFIISPNNDCTNSAMIGYDSHVTQDIQIAVSHWKEIFYHVCLLWSPEIFCICRHSKTSEWAVTVKKLCLC